MSALEIFGAVVGFLILAAIVVGVYCTTNLDDESDYYDDGI